MVSKVTQLLLWLVVTHSQRNARPQKCDFEILRRCGRGQGDGRNEEPDGFRPESFAGVHKIYA